MCISMWSDANELFLWTFEAIKKQSWILFPKHSYMSCFPCWRFKYFCSPFDEPQCELSGQIILFWNRVCHWHSFMKWQRQVDFTLEAGAGVFPLPSSTCRTSRKCLGCDTSTPRPAPPVLCGSPPEGTTVWKPFLRCWTCAWSESTTIGRKQRR